MPEKMARTLDEAKAESEQLELRKAKLQETIASEERFIELSGGSTSSEERQYIGHRISVMEEEIQRMDDRLSLLQEIIGPAL